MSPRYVPAGKTISAADAEIVGAELGRLSQHRAVTIADVLEAATPKDSLLHRFFEWDDTAAAKKWRLEQAGYLLRAVQVVIEREGDGKPITTRAFVVVEGDQGDGYVSVGVAMADPDSRKQIIDRALRELQDWRRRYESLSELADVFAAADAVAGQRQASTRKAARETRA